MVPIHHSTDRSWHLHPSPGFVDWLAQCDVSLLVTTYQVGKLLLLGRTDAGELSVSQRTFPRAMGVWTDGQVIWLASAYQVWRLVSQFDRRQRNAGYDRLFVPQLAFTTGDLDLHDIAVDSSGRPVFVATLFNCLATVSESVSFTELWRPPFISELAAEDRCHLNGLAMVEGRPQYVTLCGPTNARKAWKQCRDDGGMVLDTITSEPVARGLSMPHSPRWYQGRLWVLNTGTGWLGHVDLDSGKFHSVAFCPGYARGLAFVDRYAVVGLSRPREQNRFGGLALDAALQERGLAATTGLQVVDLDTGEVVHTLTIEGHVAELYDVAVLPGCRRPAALGLQPDPLRYNIWTETEGRRRHWRGRSSSGGAAPTE